MIKSWQERVGEVSSLAEELVAREAERADLRAALATARKDERARCEAAMKAWDKQEYCAYRPAQVIHNLTDE